MSFTVSGICHLQKQEKHTKATKVVFHSEQQQLHLHGCKIFSVCARPTTELTIEQALDHRRVNEKYSETGLGQCGFFKMLRAFECCDRSYHLKYQR